MLDLESEIGSNVIAPMLDNVTIHPTQTTVDSADPTTTLAFAGGPLAPGTNENAPSWKWVAPPGVGDAPQHVYNTYALLPFNIQGPGDQPIAFLSDYVQPVWLDQHINLWGSPIYSGGFEMSPLWTPEPTANPSNQPFAGAGL